MKGTLWCFQLGECILITAFMITACQTPAVAPAPTVAPSLTPLPTATPTVTPTPAPREIEISNLLEECEPLAAGHIPVILSGNVFLPDETIYGYKGWYGVDLISTQRVRVLFSVGTGTNQMEDLPQYFHEQDLLIHSADGGLIRHGHKVKLTGRVNYRADSDNRRCEVYVDNVVSLMPQTVLEPLDVTLEELLDGDEIADCDDLEFSRQFVRLSGAVTLDDNTSRCQAGVCTLTFADRTGSATVYLLEGEGANQMRTLPDQFSNQDLVIRDKTGALVNNHQLQLVGVTRQGDIGKCELIVYRVEAGE